MKLGRGNSGTCYLGKAGAGIEAFRAPCLIGALLTAPHEMRAAMWPKLGLTILGGFIQFT
jgi:hypothetical protein